ncbi:Uncharacterized membrane protein YoaT, DUF817 family [Gracilibacillus ureilyticus]|uniref:Uncharacterized membrane protein YoaT, DUF817 family n=1 Tax=Gracilibacillus ureilyticus TaxID=531814 RepID=A0A1H9QQE5_9BACI|nr:DUF817 domain-containing protein [Gracilibacillus ureilyticus]SER62455.1 Uncharacterized membrane protein YoaT, DUF817 family [Gracilibacillus ureilyticus]
MKQLWTFGIEQAKSCLFAVVIFSTLAITQMIELSNRYDWILLICIITQIIMLVTHLETWDELKVICVFHIIGLALEIYKVHMGSWSYPEEAFTKVFGVPLYSGFMYASVASYLCQAWRRLDVRLVKWPPNWTVAILSAAIYFNFFTHHFICDFRWFLKIATVLLFIRTVVFYKVNDKVYQMPVVLSFVLIGFFIWIAENIATFFGAWQYPNQSDTWQIVHFSKISSWLLLVIVSFLIVAMLKHIKGTNKESHT